MWRSSRMWSATAWSCWKNNRAAIGAAAPGRHHAQAASVGEHRHLLLPAIHRPAGRAPATGEHALGPDPTRRAPARPAVAHARLQQRSPLDAGPGSGGEARRPRRGVAGHPARGSQVARRVPHPRARRRQRGERRPRSGFADVRRRPGRRSAPPRWPGPCTPCCGAFTTAISLDGAANGLGFGRCLTALSLAGLSIRLSVCLGRYRMDRREIFL